MDASAPITFAPSPIRRGEAFHIYQGMTIVADVYWDSRPIPAAPDEQPIGWCLRWRAPDDNALVDSPDYDDPPGAILLDEAGDLRLNRHPQAVALAALDHALGLTEERLAEPPRQEAA